MSLDVTLYREIDGENDNLFSCNITNNLSEMASEAGIFEILWRPFELDADIKAKDIVETLENGISAMEREPERFDKFDAKNGWGRRKDLIRFCKEYLEACKNYPDANIHADS